MISNAEIDNMAKATQMSDAQLVAMLRTISTVYDDETLAKWILAVAAERLEKRTQETPLIDEVETRTINALCYITTDVKEAARQLRHARDNARELVKLRRASSPNVEVNHAHPKTSNDGA